MKNKFIALSVSSVVVAGLMAFAPLASAMAPWVGPTDTDQSPYPTYDTDARWSYQTDGDVTTTGLYPTYGDDARWSYSTNGDNTTQTDLYPTYGDDTPDQPIFDDNTTMCAADAMQCADGSYVGRSGPNCQFVCGDVMPYPTHGDDARWSYPTADNNVNGPYPTFGDDARWSDEGDNYAIQDGTWNADGSVHVDGSANMNNLYYNDNAGMEMNGSLSFAAFLQNLFPFWQF